MCTLYYIHKYPIKSYSKFTSHILFPKLSVYHRRMLFQFGLISLSLTKRYMVFNLVQLFLLTQKYVFELSRQRCIKILLFKFE